VATKSLLHVSTFIKYNRIQVPPDAPHVCPIEGHSYFISNDFVFFLTSGFAQLTKQLMELAEGRLVMALEGGYSLPSLCDAAEACLRGLLCQKVSPISL
jgi:hypothetical protein